jgi:hypothetical protein
MLCYKVVYILKWVLEKNFGVPGPSSGWPVFNCVRLRISRGPLIQRSWTPDWTQPRAYDLATYDLMLHGICNNTGFDASSGRECNALFADDLSALSAEGIGIFWDIISFKTTTVNLCDPQQISRPEPSARAYSRSISRRAVGYLGSINSRKRLRRQ